jgi:hypothetical protein
MLSTNLRLPRSRSRQSIEDRPSRLQNTIRTNSGSWSSIVNCMLSFLRQVPFLLEAKKYLFFRVYQVREKNKKIPHFLSYKTEVFYWEHCYFISPFSWKQVYDEWLKPQSLLEGHQRSLKLHPKKKNPIRTVKKKEAELFGLFFVD